MESSKHLDLAFCLRAVGGTTTHPLGQHSPCCLRAVSGCRIIFVEHFEVHLHKKKGKRLLRYAVLWFECIYTTFRSGLIFKNYEKTTKVRSTNIIFASAICGGADVFFKRESAENVSLRIQTHS